MTEKIVDLPVIRHTPSGPVCATIPIARVDYDRIKAMGPGSSYFAWLTEGIRVEDEQMGVRWHLL